MPLLDRVQITGDRQPTGEEWNRLQTNIERALRRLQVATQTVVNDSVTVVTTPTQADSGLRAPILDGGDDDGDGGATFMLPGPSGRAGRDGRDGQPGMDGDDPEEPMIIVGPTGPRGARGLDGMPTFDSTRDEDATEIVLPPTLSATSLPALGARFIVQVPSAHLPNAQALSPLASGVMHSVITTGVVSTYAMTGGRIAHGSGVDGALTDSNLLWYQVASSQSQLTVGASTTDAGANILAVGNTTAGLVRLSIGSDRTQTLNMGLNTTVGPFFAAHTDADGTTSSGNFAAVRQDFGGNGLIVNTSPATAAGVGRTYTERMRVAIGGNVSVANLSGGGVVFVAPATSGVLKIGSAAEVASAIVWPTAAQVLISSGTTTAPVGDVSFTYDTGTDTLTAGVVNIATSATIGGTTTANSAALLQTNMNANASVWNVVANSSAGNAATESFLLTNAQNNIDNYFAFTLFGTGYATSGLLGARVGRIELSSNASPGNLIIGNASASGDIVFYTTASRTERMRLLSIGNVTFTPGASTSGSPTLFTITGPAHTGLTVFTEAIDVDINLARTVTWANGDLALQRAMVIRAPTYAMTSALRDIDRAVTLSITGAPIEGSNVDIIEGLALHVESGRSLFSGAVFVTPPAGTGTQDVGLRYQGAAHTALTASAEFNDVYFNLTRTVQWATGALATQRAVYIGAPTYGFVGASVITKAATVSIAGAPTAGTNATITTALALDIESGAQAWHNVTGTNYERVRAFWSANVWTVASEAAGSGTLRNTAFSAAGITSTATTGTNAVYSATGSYLATTLGSNPDVIVEPTVAKLRYNLTAASATSYTFDGVTVEGTLILTGSTNVTSAGGVNATRFSIPSYNGGGSAKTVTNAATVKIEGSPLGAGSLTITNAYALWVSGLARFDGNGTRVFELPADATGNVSAAVGRVPVLIGGTTRYLRYYAD